jgi:hypothetical protein
MFGFGMVTVAPVRGSLAGRVEHGLAPIEEYRIALRALLDIVGYTDPRDATERLGEELIDIDQAVVRAHVALEQLGCPPGYGRAWESDPDGQNAAISTWVRAQGEEPAEPAGLG